MSSLLKFLGYLVLTATLIGCEDRGDLAPVTESRWLPLHHQQNRYVVQRGDTLYSIAFRYDTDYRTLAALNSLPPPYRLRIGQVLRINGTVSRPLASTFSSSPTPKRQPGIKQPLPKQSLTRRPSMSYPVTASGWFWPIRGRVVMQFMPNQGKKGINIASNKGERVHAALSGVVAYAGNGLGGYGNLIIIKHNNEFLTAYGNNRRNLVSEGQAVKTGQVIAEVGLIEHRYWGVHFEIRKRGVPVNPLNYLQKG